MRNLFLNLLVPLGLVACATVPTTMDPDLFNAELSRLNDNPSPPSADSGLTALLARTDLTEQQRFEVLYARADKRWTAKYDLPGAISDFDRFLMAVPDDLRASESKRHKVFAATEIENAQRRLARLQTLTAWFDDKVLMGDLSAGADRYRTSGITPTDGHLYLLREGGFVCEGDGESVHQYGPEPEYAAGAVWCSDPSLS